MRLQAVLGIGLITLVNAQDYVFTTLAGPMEAGQGAIDGTGNAARFNQLFVVAVDSAGNLYVADTYNHTIRKVTPNGVVTTSAGLAGPSGTSDAAGNAARFHGPSGVTADSASNQAADDCFISFNLPQDRILQGPTHVGELHFTAVSGQSSAFAPLVISDVDGRIPTSQRLWSTWAGVVIGTEPLLEASLFSTTNITLTLYGNPGANYLIRYSTNLSSALWLSGWSAPMTNLWETWKINVTAPQLFDRAE